MLRYWWISRIHLQLGYDFTDVVLAQEESCDVQVLTELGKTRFGFSYLFFGFVDDWAIGGVGGVLG